MINKLIQLWATTKTSYKNENICPFCQSLRLAAAALCGTKAATSFGGFATSFGVVFLLLAFLAWNYRAQVMVWVTKARIWFAERRAEKSEGGL